MQLHELKPTHKNKGKKRVGRGGKKGTYSGKGIKGQKSRAGRKMVPIIRELIKKYPKLRGYKTVRLQNYSVVVNLNTLEKFSADGEVITPDSLNKKGITRKIKGRLPEVKILANGELKKKLIIEGCKVSAHAREAIEKAGGSVKNLK